MKQGVTILKAKIPLQPIITLLTDFGERDPYAGAMKGVILSICPNAKIIDLSHSIQRHNIYEGAFHLLAAAKYFPKNTIHLVVIDPDVGSSRRALIIQSRNYRFIGPDNGVLSLAALDDEVQKIIEICNSSYFLKPVSQTFHGRDIFAPVAAHLANNRNIEDFGSVSQEWVQIKIPEINIDGNVIYAEVIHVDKFGNIITNISQENFQKINKIERSFIEFQFKKFRSKIKLCKSYNEVEIGEFLAIFGSSNFLEVARNRDSAANALKVQIKDKILVELID